MKNQIKKFSIFEAPLVEKKVVFTFGRFNPPTTGHEKLIDKVKSVAGSDDYRIYPSQSQNQNKDPLPYAKKIAYMRKMFPKHKRSIAVDRNPKTAIDVATSLYNAGYKDVTMVVGSDRVKEFETLLKKYNGVKARHGMYKFDNINVVSAGDRDPDAEGVSGMSASKMRKAATDGNMDEFMKGLPRGFRDGKSLYRDIRKNMGIREQKDMGIMNDYESKRDAYLTGKIWKIGDIIEAKDMKGPIVQRGTNYVSMEVDNKIHRVWLHDIEEGVSAFNPTVHNKDIGVVSKDQEKRYKALSRIDQMKVKRLVKRKVSIEKALRQMRETVEDGKVDLMLKHQDGYNVLKQVNKEYDRGLLARVNKDGSYDMAYWYEKFKPYPVEVEIDGKIVSKDAKKIRMNFHPVDKDDEAGKGQDEGVMSFKEYAHGGRTQGYGMYQPQADLNASKKVKQDRDVKDEPGTQPAKYYKGVSKKSKDDRAAHFRKGAKMDDNNPAAYAPAPGDAKGKTKPSKFTQKYKKMFGEQMPKTLDQVLNEKIEGLVKKADKSGIAYSILKQVYNRGMAAWRTGHRPGTTPQQWAFARVNSFVTKSKGTWGGADKDLASKARGSKSEALEYPGETAKQYRKDTPGQEESLWANIHKKRQRIKQGSGEKMRKKGDKGAPTPAQLQRAKNASEETVQSWFESTETRGSYEYKYGENWWWKLNETHDAMLEKIGVCCEDCLDEATMVSDISGISIPNLKKEAKKKNIKVSRVTPGGPMGAEYEVTFTGSEKDLMAYAKEHLGFEGRNFRDLKKHLNMGEQITSWSTYKEQNAWGEIEEDAEYQGRKVKLNNPMKGDVKKTKVYVKNDKGNVVKVEFGDPNMSIKRDDPARRKSFRARHNCDNPGPKYKARYWSCKFWSGKSVSDLMKG